MTATIGDRLDRMGMWRVLAAWVGDRPSEGSGDRFLDQHVSAFESISRSQLLEQVPPKGLPIELQQHGWLVGRALTDDRLVVPVATVQLDGTTHQGVTRCTLRLALLQARDDDASVHATGWRFELAETAGPGGEAAMHPYQHAQSIAGWAPDSFCLIHKPHTDDDGCDGAEATGEPGSDKERAATSKLVLQSHPAFPLATVSLTGLAATMVTALYGARRAREILDTDQLLWRMGHAPGNDLRLLFDKGLSVAAAAASTGK